MYPEGVAYDATSDSFFVGSVRAGAIGRIDARGNYTVFADGPELVSSAGLFVDRARHRLLAAVGDVGVAERSSAVDNGRLARVVEVDLSSGKVVRSTDFQGLPGVGTDEHHLANDVTVDGEGNVYVTDSLAPLIYRLDARGHASVFARSPLFAAPSDARPGEPNLNGIVAHPHGYLLVGHWAKGQLLKVPLADPSRVRVVADGIPGADGLLLRGDRELVVVRNYAEAGKVRGSATLLSSSDDWETVRIAAHGRGNEITIPTTAALRGNDVWVVNFPYDEFFPSPTTAARREIVLSRLHFDVIGGEPMAEPSRR
jgi:sugar lactone lactonase YvrE